VNERKRRAELKPSSSVGIEWRGVDNHGRINAGICNGEARDGARRGLGARGLNVPAGSNEDFIVNVGRRVFFAENSAALDDTAKTTLDNQAEWLSTYPAYKVKVEGFSDEKGSAQFNMQLGQKRAEAVVTYLTSKGIPAARLKAKSFGNAPNRKVKACDDISCWSQNRRAVTVLVTDFET
jgi:peptidoglycan-associated lipoprotein